jgi:superfamily II DNA or RNA helicase/nicotinamide mononucleotide adenylyltransferase
MPTHDIIDNRNAKLVDSITTMLGQTELARFAVGYFFVSGLESISKALGDHVKELRLLIGNTTNSRTLEQMAEGHRRLSLVQEELDEDIYRKKADKLAMAAETAENVRSAVELMDQTDIAEETVHVLVRMIEEKRLKVRVYTKGRMHAKAYIFSYGDTYNVLQQIVPKHEKGIAVVGSSNLSLAGVSHNTELNVVVSGNNNHDELCKWFDELWEESQDFDEALMEEMKQSWVLAAATPYDIYMKTLYSLVKARLDVADVGNLLWDDDIFRQLTVFQQDAVKQATGMIRKNRGVFVADVVGLGKSFIGAAIVKHFERTEGRRALILSPATLVPMWDRYIHDYDLKARVVSMGMLTEGEDGENILLDNDIYADRDFLLIDESHNLRNVGTQRYRLVSDYMLADPNRRCCFLTATPRNKTAWDVYNQIKLFHTADKTDLPIDPPDLRRFFAMIEKHERNLPDLLTHVLIRRTRNYVLRYYGYDSETNQRVDPTDFAPYLTGERRAYVKVGGNNQYFPRRELKTIQYSIEDTYQGLYQELRGYLGKAHKEKSKLPKSYDGEMTYARYGLFRYVKDSAATREPYKNLKSTGPNLKGLARVLLFKRFESSVEAFRKTVGRFLESNRRFLAALEGGMVPAGEDAQSMLYKTDDYEEQDFLDALQAASEKYLPDDFHFDLLKAHVAPDIDLLKELLAKVEPITPERDAKLQKLLKLLPDETLNKGKRLIFTQYSDTAEYIYEHLNKSGRADVDVITGDVSKSKFRLVGRFSPHSNPDYKPQSGESELNTVVATDVLSEGLNMQDCDTIINYDLHWNPVRLIQRFGRIDRIGSTHDKVLGMNFLPETKLDEHLHLRETLGQRIQEIQDTIGEDSAILDPTEKVNEEAMYAIYDDKPTNLDLFEPEEPMGLGEAEGILRQLRADDPAEFDRIASLRDGLRSGMDSLTPGIFVLCQAGDFQQLFFVDSTGEVETRDASTILGRIKCTPSTPIAALPANYNASVMKVYQLFAEEAALRKTTLEHSTSLSVGQRYVLQELKSFATTLDEEDPRQTDVAILQRAYSSHALSAAVQTELRRIRNHKLTGESLFARLRNIYDQHRLSQLLDEVRAERQVSVPRIVCSESLI